MGSEMCIRDRPRTAAFLNIDQGQHRRKVSGARDTLQVAGIPVWRRRSETSGWGDCNSTWRRERSDVLFDRRSMLLPGRDRDARFAPTTGDVSHASGARGVAATGRRGRTGDPCYRAVTRIPVLHTRDSYALDRIGQGTPVPPSDQKPSCYCFVLECASVGCTLTGLPVMVVSASVLHARKLRTLHHTTVKTNLSSKWLLYLGACGHITVQGCLGH